MRLQNRLPRHPPGRAYPPRPGIRVEPANEALRKLLIHPSGMKFRSTGSVEFPDDQYTRKQLAAGGIKKVEPPKPAEEQRPAEEAPKPEARHGRRSRAEPEAEQE